MSIGVLILLAVALSMYALPSIVAHGRRHRNAVAIGVANLFLGWTAIGWILTLVWACTDNTHAHVPRSSVAPGG